VDSGEGGARAEGSIADVRDAAGDSDEVKGGAIVEGPVPDGNKCISRYQVAEWQGGRCVGRLTDPRDREVRAIP